MEDPEAGSTRFRVFVFANSVFIAFLTFLSVYSSQKRKLRVLQPLLPLQAADSNAGF